MKNYTATISNFLLFQPKASREGGPSSDPDVRRKAESSGKLRVTFAAAHAGTVNRNHIFYLPRGMSSSLENWTLPIPKPIQIHHDDSADPIGRIASARLAPITENQEYNEALEETINLFRNADDPESVREAIKSLKASGVLDDSNWKGVAFEEVTGYVTDSSAIQKILDGRYNGVSVTIRPQEVYCSICNQELTKDGMCEHNRGEIDEETGERCFYIVGKKSNEEISFVNRPADPDARVLEAVFSNSIRDDLDLNYHTDIKFELMADNNDQDNIHNSQEEDPILNAESNSEVETSSPPDELEASSATEDTSEDVEDEVTEDLNQEDEQESDLPSLEESLSTLIENPDNLNEYHSDVLHTVLEELVIEEDRSAELTTKKRKSLPDSAFCAPGRNFPVNDCAHYTAALRLLGRYKGPGDKDKIRACIERKGKKMGCTSDDNSNETQSCSDLSLDNLEDEKVISYHQSLEQIMVARGLKLPKECSSCEEKAESITSLQNKISDLETKLTVLREELQLSSSDSKSARDELANVLEEYETLLREKVELFKLLSNQETTEEDIRASISELSFEELRNEQNSVDFSESINFFRSGMSREPEITDEISSEDAACETEEVDTEKVEKEVAKQVVKFYSQYGLQFVNNYIDKQVTLSKLPVGFTLAKAQELVAK